MPTALITGANRGIGLELARQYAADGYKVHACCRKPDEASDLAGLAGDVNVHALDVTDHEAVDRLAGEIDEPLDVVIANAGIYGPQGDAQVFGSLDYDGLRHTMEVNTLGAVKTIEAFAPHAKRSDAKKMAAITSEMGSIADASGGVTAYRASKAALNMALAVAAPELKNDGVAVGLLHPGWVQTDMGGPNARITPEESARNMRGQIERLQPSDKAPFLAHDGREIPW